MFVVESYADVRRFVFVEGHSRREASRVFGLSRETVSKMCRFSLPPGYTRTKPVGKPKLGALLPVIDEILTSNQAVPVKQRHTAKRIFERLRDEHGFGGGYTVVKDYVRICRSKGRETFVPLSHSPGHAQVDFGEAIAIIGGVRQKIHFFCMDVPQSDACFVEAYERGSTIVTSNLPFEDWTSVLGSERLTGALLDRLTHHVSILTMNGDSYRLKQSAARRRVIPSGAEQNQATQTVEPDTGEILTS